MTISRPLKTRVAVLRLIDRRPFLLSWLVVCTIGMIATATALAFR